MSVKPCAPPAAEWADQSLLGEKYEARSCGPLAVRVDSGLSCANARDVMLTHLCVTIEELGHPKFDNDHGSNASMDFPDVTPVLGSSFMSQEKLISTSDISAGERLIERSTGPHEGHVDILVDGTEMHDLDNVSLRLDPES